MLEKLKHSKIYIKIKILTSWENLPVKRHRKHFRQLLSIVRHKDWQDERAKNFRESRDFRESRGGHIEKERDGVTKERVCWPWPRSLVQRAEPSKSLYTCPWLSINKSLNDDLFMTFWPTRLCQIKNRKRPWLFFKNDQFFNNKNLNYYPRWNSN